MPKRVNIMKYNYIDQVKQNLNKIKSDSSIQPVNSDFRKFKNV